MTDDEFQKLVTRLIEPCKQMIQSGKNLEDAFEYLKTESDSKIVSIAVISKVMDISLGDAKGMVHTSKAWSYVQERDEKFHQLLISEIEQTQKKN